MADNKELFKSVIDTVDIVETVKKYAKLEKLDSRDVSHLAENSAVYWLGLCPFRNCIDKWWITDIPPAWPSLEMHPFMVSAFYKSFYCFNCHASGNVIDFMSKLGHMNKLTAARFLKNTAKKQEEPV